MKKRIQKILRAIHKYLGLFLLFYLMWMSISGIILNHPKLIDGLSVNKFFVPEYYHVKNWHRGGLRSVVFTDSLNGYAYGKQGVYLTPDAGKTFVEYMSGDFPSSPYNRKTTHIFYDSLTNQLIASTKAGFYNCSLKDGKWKRFESLTKIVDAKKIIQVKNKYIAISHSNFFVANDIKKLDFEKLVVNKAVKSDKVSLVTLFFMLHDGSIFGDVGRVFWDGIALVLLFLSFSAIYLWIIPKSWKRKRKNKKKIPKKDVKRFAWYYKYHLKLGIYFSLFLFVIVGTGMFIHPPLIMAIMGSTISKKFVPVSNNPWKKKVRNILYDKARDKVLLDAGGLWECDADFKTPFVRADINVRIFAMGSTVFQCDKDSTLIIGSFGGLQRINSVTGRVRNMLPIVRNAKPSRSGLGKYMITGYFKAPNGQEYFNAHVQGLHKIDATIDTKLFVMPKFMNTNYRMSLWNIAFEIHNGRIFKSLIGFFYFFINPLLGLLTLIMILTGVLFWVYKKIN